MKYPNNSSRDRWFGGARALTASLLVFWAALLPAGCTGGVADAPTDAGDSPPGQSAGGDGSPAVDDAPAALTGACCIGLQCEVLTRDDCIARRGVFRTIGSACDVSQCVLILATTDTDGDGASDLEELENGTDPEEPADGPDIDGDGIPNGQDFDVDGDGISNFIDIDIDGDGIPNISDIDDDGDGKIDIIDADVDGDGLPESECNVADGDSDCDGNTICCQGFCVDPSTDPKNCGGCNQKCEGACCQGTCLDNAILNDNCGGCLLRCEGPCCDGKCCSDGLDCTVDICNSKTGCRHEPNDSFCNDNIDCTRDVCDARRGCMNIPVDDRCDDDFSCTDDICSTTDGCLFLRQDFRCDDGIPCTADSCTPTPGNEPTGCQYLENDTRCDADGSECNDAKCIAARGGCVQEPNDSHCPNDTDCTINACDETGRCVVDILECDDGVSCTEDICTLTQGCIFTPDNDNCDDGIACTEDICDVTEDCMFLPDDSVCPDDSACGSWRCDPGSGGCVNNDDTCTGTEECCEPDTCIDVMTSDDHCGECDNACGLDEECVEGACEDM